MTKLMEEEIIPNLVKTRNEGQKEYAHAQNNVFANFERVAEAINASEMQVLWVYFLKHVDGISAYIKGHKSQREDVRGRIIDAMVYLSLFYGMVEESEANEWRDAEE